MKPKNFKLYAVGGYIRDTLLGREAKDLDIVVVGATEEEFMAFGDSFHESLNFKQVGSDFPVFLDRNGLEWAFARKERKVGDGYHGFQVESDPTVTLEEDLFRRDLTINAMAREITSVLNGGNNMVIDEEIIDPFGGQKDLEDRRFRHVSDHFAEDPVRVLRLARFAARYGFSVDDGTHELIEMMCRNGELDHLVEERVWAEMEKAMKEPYPQWFFHVLDATPALKIIFPELAEVTSFYPIVHGLLPQQRFTILAMLIGINGHQMFNRLKAPSELSGFIMKFLLMVNWLHEHELTDERIMWLFKTTNIFRDPMFFHKSALVAIATGKKRLEDQLNTLMEAFDEVKHIGFADLSDHDKANLKGPAIGEGIRMLMLSALHKM